MRPAIPLALLLAGLVFGCIPTGLLRADEPADTGETATLNIEVEGTATEGPDYSPLLGDFHLAGHTSRRSFAEVNATGCTQDSDGVSPALGGELHANRGVGYRADTPRRLMAMKLVAAWFKIPFWQRVLAGFLLGALAGWLAGPAAETWFGPFGDLYVTLIKLIAAPLVFFAVIHAVASLHGQKSMVSLGGRTFAWFAFTAMLAVGVGLGVGTLMQPGVGVGALAIASDYVPRTVPDPIQVLMDVVPENAFYALTGIGEWIADRDSRTLYAPGGVWYFRGRVTLASDHDAVLVQYACDDEGELWASLTAEEAQGSSRALAGYLDTLFRTKLEQPGDDVLDRAGVATSIEHGQGRHPQRHQ